MNIAATILSAADEIAYEAFLAACPAATFYHSLRYRDLLIAVTGANAEYLICKDDAGSISGVLPLMSRDGPFGTVINSLPFFGSYGGVLATDSEAAAVLWQAYGQKLEKPGLAAATVIDNPFAITSTLPPFPPSYIDTRIAQITPLDGADAGAKLMARIDSSTRRNIRKAEQSGVTVAVENSAIGFLARTHCANMAEIGGVAKPASFFEEFPRIFRANDEYRIYIARLDGKPVAALLLFYYKDFVEYFTPATEDDQRGVQPMAAILHRAMLDAAAEGRRIWNWGGTWTSQTGVYRFKRKWGAEERVYSYNTHVVRPDLLTHGAATLRSEYPWFFVVPFGVLTESAL